MKPHHTHTQKSETHSNLSKPEEGALSMGVITQFPSKSARMSSTEIADLTKKQHRHVMRDITKLINEQAITESNFGPSEYKDPSGKLNPMYLLDFQATMTLITGYDAKRRALIIDRWTKLETGEAKPAMTKPTTQLEVLASLTQEMVKNEQKVAALEMKTQETANEVERIRHHIETNGCRPGFIPMQEAFDIYGRQLSYSIFKKMIRATRHPSSKYSFALPEGGTGFGMSVQEKDLQTKIDALITSSKQVSAKFYQSPMIPGKKFMLFIDPVH